MLAILSAIGCFLFVLACYPLAKGEQRYQYSPAFFSSFCGADSFIHVHVQNDWLTGTWLFYYASLCAVIGSAVMFVVKLYARDMQEIYIWFFSLIDSTLFLIGSAYFVAGSYPVNSLAKSYDDLFSAEREGERLPNFGERDAAASQDGSATSASDVWGTVESEV